MQRTIPILLAVVMVVAGIAYFFLAPHQSGTQGAITPTGLPAVTYNGAALSREYRNDENHFSLMMPDDFKSQVIPADDSGRTTIILQDAKGDGVQIITSPYDDIKVLTADMIRSSIPDLAISDVQELQIGNDYKGVAFRSDNAAFGGDSREVWFVFRGTLYQISTYARLDSLMKAMFATWKFY